MLIEMKIIDILKKHLLLISLTSLGVIIRVIFLSHNYPYIFNNDEPTLVRSAMGLFYSWEIDRFDWPHFSFYFYHFIFFLFVKFRGLIQILNLRSLIEPAIPVFWQDPVIFYYLVRFMNGLFGGLTAIPVYLTSKNLFKDNKMALLAAFLFVLMPEHVFQSHFALLDVLLTFWFSLALLFLTRLYNNYSYSNLIWSGVFLGIATGVKYNGILALGFYCSLVLLSLIRTYKTNELIKQIKIVVVLISISLTVFLLTSPYIILKWDTFWSYEYGKGILWQVKTNSKAINFELLPSHLRNQLASLILDVNPVIFCIFIFGLLRLLSIENREHKKYLIALYIFAMIYFILMARNNRAGPRFYLPLYPVIAMISGYVFSTLLLKYAKYYKILLIFVSVCLIYDCSANLIILNKSDTRLTAVQYLKENKLISARIYAESEKMVIANFVNNLGYKEYKREKRFRANDLVVSENPLSTKELRLINTISNNGRLGPPLYIYKFSSDYTK